MRFRIGVCVCCVLLSAVAVAQGQERQIEVQVRAPGGGLPLPVKVPVNFTRASAQRAPVEAGSVRVVRVAGAGKTEPVLFDWLPAAEYDAGSNAVGVVSWMVKPSAARQDFLILYGGKPPRVQQPAGELQVEETPDAIVVRNAGYEVAHPKRANGGLPASIKFLPKGPEFSSFRLNDRVYDKKTKRGYRLREDEAPRVEVVSRSALGCVVRTTARYLADGQAPPSKPRATYEFSYYAGSPLVQVTGHAVQDKAFEWSEHHFLEINYPDLTFPRWALGPGDKHGTFENALESFRGTWGVLLNDQAALGMLGSGSVIIYDGYKQYGNYLHGPWVQWNTTSQDFKAYLWLGPGAGAEQAVAEAAAALHRGLEVRALTPTLKKSLRGCEYRIEQLKQNLAKVRDPKRRAAGQRLAQKLEWQRDTFVAALSDATRLRRAAMLAEKLEQRIGDQAAAFATGGAEPAYSAWTTELPDGSEQTLMQYGDLGLGLAVDERAGLSVSSIRNFRTGQEFVSQRTRVPLWELELYGPDHQRATVSAAGSRVEQIVRGTAAFDCRDVELPDGTKARVRCEIRFTGDGDSEWRIRIENRSKRWAVHEVRYPIVALGPLGESTADDALAVPLGWGKLWQQPLERGATFYGRYPSGAMAMQFASYADRAGGLYLATHDGQAWAKSFRFAPRSGALEFRLIQYPEDATKPHSPVEFPYACTLAVHEGGWYGAAKKYRAWALKQFWTRKGRVEDRDDIPQWLKDIAIWARCGGSAKQAVPGMLKFREFAGRPIVTHWYSWHVIPFDNDYPLYFPAKPGFKEAVAQLQAAGVRVKPYINGRLWDSENPSFEAEGKPYAAKDEQGRYYTEVYGSKVPLSPMCPATKFWQQRVAGIVERLVTEYGVDGVYIDQVGAAAPKLCYDESHGHPLGGGGHWVAGYQKMLRDALQRIKRVSPDKFLTTESEAEPYMNRFQAYLMCNSTGPDLIPLYSAVYSDRILTFGRYVGGSDLKHPPAYIGKTAQQFVFGAQLGWTDTTFLGDEWKKQAAYVRRLVDLRAAGQKYLAFGEMLRPLEPETPLPEITADWGRRGHAVTLPAVLNSVWRAKDGRVGAYFVSISEEPQKFVAEVDPHEYGLTGGSGVQWRAAGGEVKVASGRVKAGETLRLEVKVPPLQAGMVELEEVR